MNYIHIQENKTINSFSIVSFDLLQFKIKATPLVVQYTYIHVRCPLAHTPLHMPQIITSDETSQIENTHIAIMTYLKERRHQQCNTVFFYFVGSHKSRTYCRIYYSVCTLAEPNTCLRESCSATTCTTTIVHVLIVGEVDLVEMTFQIWQTQLREDIGFFF